MKKILITGDVASGKTTLAKRLSDKIDIPWYELDCVVYCEKEAGRYKRTEEEQIKVIVDIDKNGSWIFEGVDRKSYRCLFEMADIIVFLDTPLWKRRLRILVRFLKQNLGMEQCHYKPDLAMLNMMYKWAGDFERNRTDFEARLQVHKDKLIRLFDNKKINLIIKSRVTIQG